MFSKSEKWVIFTLAFLQFSHIVDFMIIMPLGPQLTRVFEITPAQFSSLVASYTFMSGLSGFLAIFYADRFDRKKILTYMYIGFFISTLFCGLAPNYTFLMISRSVAGFFGGVMGAQCLSIISDIIPFERRGTAMGVMSTAFSMASILGVPLSLYLANIYGWHAPFYFLSFVCFLVLYFVTTKIPSLTTHIQNQKKTDQIIEPLKKILLDKDQRNSLLFMSVLMFGHFAIIPFISPSLVANAGISETALPLIYLTGGICSILTAPLIGKLSDRYGKYKIYIYSLIYSFIPTLLITHQGVAPTSFVLFITGLFFISAGARMIPANTLVTNAATAEQRGSFMSILSSIQSLSMALGAWFSGFIITKNPLSGHLENYQFIGYTAVLVGLVSLFLIQKIKHLDQFKGLQKI